MKMSVSTSETLLEEPANTDEQSVEGSSQAPQASVPPADSQLPETPSVPRPACTWCLATQSMKNTKSMYARWFAVYPGIIEGPHQHTRSQRQGPHGLDASFTQRPF